MEHERCTLRPRQPPVAPSRHGRQNREGVSALGGEAVFVAQFLGFRLGDLLLHGWDLARSTGGDDKLDDLGYGLVIERHAHLGRRQNRARFVGHCFGVDKAPMFQDLEVFASEPHRLGAVGRLNLHTNQTVTAYPQVHLRYNDRSSGRAVPLPEMLRCGPHLPHQLDWSVEEAFDPNGGRRCAELSHVGRLLSWLG